MADTFKFSTLMWLIAGLIIPLWPLSLPLCWFMAYRSYKGGTPPPTSLSDLQAAIDLHKSGNLSDDDLAAVKSRTIGKGA
tara:strand:- start:11861 stop:12100 length:240 start_codon:yes stop_codon:yes gene_type:complete